MSAESSVHPAILGCLQVLDRCTLVLDRIPESLYTKCEPPLESIGAHLRHAIEHFVCFLDGLAGLEVDYDQRCRDELLETDVAEARRVIEELRTKLLEINIPTLEKAMRVVQLPGMDQSPVALESSVVCELIFLSSHMVHHLSLIYLRCANAGIDLPEDVPLAFSTIAHRDAVVG